MIGIIETAILKSIIDGHDYGASIETHISDVYGIELPNGQIYVALSRMEHTKSFLTSQMSEPRRVRGGKSRRIYSITDAGCEALEKFLDFVRCL
jgi:PadR family transcriptional regulator, regulatory protein PadR